MEPTGKRKLSTDFSQQVSKRQNQGRDPFDLILDPDGDLRLCVTESLTTRNAAFVVSRSTLCLSSPVFRAMLDKHPNFPEGQRPNDGSTQKIELEEDNLESLVVFLRIIHLRCDEVPQTMNAQQIQHMASLCDKYDSSISLGMWPATWLQAEKEPWSTYDSISQIRIANAFGLEHLLAQATRAIVLRCAVGPDGALQTKDHGLLEGKISETILGKQSHYMRLCESKCYADAIREERSSLIDTIEEKILCLQELLEETVEPCARSYRDVNTAVVCCTFQLGQLRRAFPMVNRSDQNRTFKSMSFTDIKTCGNDLNGMLDIPAFSVEFANMHMNCNEVEQLGHWLDNEFVTCPSPREL